MLRFKAIGMAVTLGGCLFVGAASATTLTWDYGGGPTVYNTASQPVTFTAGGVDTNAAAFTFTTGLFGSLTLTSTALSQLGSGLGVCDGGLTESNLGCAQIDRIGSNDLLRIQLPSAAWTSNAVEVGLVSPIDAFVLLGGHTASPTNTSQLTPLDAGLIATLGTDEGNGLWSIALGDPTGFEYLFFTTTAENGGYDLRSLTASVQDGRAGQVPEPGTLALLLSGMLGFGVIRLRSKTA
jgi:hypothetical protein